MAPVGERAEVATVAMGMQRGETPSCLTTTLYDLITAVQTVVGPDDDALVVAMVVPLLRSGQLTWRGKAKTHLYTRRVMLHLFLSQASAGSYGLARRDEKQE